MRRSRPGSLLFSLAFLAGVVGTSPAQAAAPAPPLDACLRAGSFLIQDQVCLYRRPAGGDQFGPISGITVLTVPRGQAVVLSIPGGSDVGFGPQPNELCGDLGCVRNGARWRTGAFTQGLTMVDGCGGEDADCTMTSAPPFVGDRGEIFQVVYGQIYRGSYPTSASQMWAVYTPPSIYPVELTPVDTSGGRLALNHDVVGYAVHAGANPVAAACVEPFWYEAVLSQPTPPVPDCVTLRRGGNIYSLEGTFEGWLPVDSGDWTIVADPAGDAGTPLLSRPSGYRHVSVRPTGNDIAAPIVGEARPDLAIEIAPRAASIDLGEEQVVDVTVRASGGEAGSLPTVTFDDPSVLVQGSAAPPLEVVSVDPPVPAVGFPLEIGGSRTFAVTVRAVALGADSLGASVSAVDDLGDPRAAGERGVAFLVEVGDALGGPGAPEPPTIDQAVAGDAARSGSLEGTVEGEPGADVTVTLVSAPIGGDGTCLAQLEGPMVTGLGSVAVAIDEGGVGRFALDAPLSAGWHVYGITVGDAGVSAIGPCTAVSETTPRVSIDDVEAPEGTTRKGTTGVTLELRLSGPPIAPVRVRISTRDGTAAAPGDYTPIDGQEVTFAPGQASASVTLEVAADADREEDETIGLELSDPVGADIATGTATVTIMDDDTVGTGGDFDIRGTWTMVAIPAAPTTDMSLRITDFDAATGAWSGSFILVLDPSVKLATYAACFKGRTCTLPAKGTLRGDRLTVSVTQEGRTSKLAGTITRKRGTLTVLLTGKDTQGQPSKGRLTLRDPAS